MSETVAIASGGLAARIAPLGAELRSLSDAAGREYMSDGNPAFWPNHAPLLFPIVGALANDTYRLGGEEHGLSRHGFARRSFFELVEHAPDRALFRLTDSKATRRAYPFAFVLEMGFALDGMVLSMEARVRNPGGVPLPFSFGYHPAFAWPLPGGGDKLGHYLEFECEEPQEIRRLDENGLLAFEELSPLQGRVLKLDSRLFDDDAMIWDRLESRGLSYVSPGGTRLEVDFPDTPMLGIWQKPGANFICIEPWAGHADPAGFAGDFREKPGIMELAPGEARSFRMDVAVQPV